MIFLPEGQGEAESGPLGRGGFGFDRALMRGGDALGDGEAEAEAGTAEFAGERRAEEGVEDVGEVFGRNAGASVVEGDGGFLGIH